MFCFFFGNSEFKKGQLCEIIQNDPRHYTMPKLFKDRIGEQVIISAVQDNSHFVWAYEAKPIRYRINRLGNRVVDFDPRCVTTPYNKDDLLIL